VPYPSGLERNKHSQIKVLAALVKPKARAFDTRRYGTDQKSEEEQNFKKLGNNLACLFEEEEIFLNY
jgi:hypothetical protein